MKRGLILSAVVAVLLGGCTGQPVAIEVTHLAGWATYPPQPFVQVLQDRPARGYVPVARLSINSSSGLDRAQALAALQQKARALGANAIIVNDETEPESPQLTFNPSGGSYNLAPVEPPMHMLAEAIHLEGADTPNQ